MHCRNLFSEHFQMTTKTVIEYVSGELSQDGEKVYDAKLRLTIMKVTSF